MTSRERIRALLAGGTPDRMPNGLGGCETAGMHCLAYERLKRVAGVESRRNRVCTFMTNAVFEPEVLDAIGGDMILLGSRMCPSRLWGPNADSEWKDLPIWDTTLQVANEWQFRRDHDGTWWWNDWAKCPPGGIYFDAPAVPSELPTEYPSPTDFRPSLDLPDALLRRLQEDARFLYETTPYSIVCGEMIHDLQLQPGGQQSWWMQMVERPDTCHEFLDRAVDAALSQLRQLDDAVGDYCDILGIAHDFGDLRGVTCGPETWRAIYKPHYKRLFEGWHRITGMKANLHSCGSIVDILDDLIECGVDILNPVQISARGMAPEALAEGYGDRIIFYGGALDSVLTPPGTPADIVYHSVKENVRTLGSHGRYIFAGVHNITGDIPAEHLDAMLRAYRDMAM